MEDTPVKTDRPVRTRVAPSPTGYPHIGTIYQAMFDHVMAKKYGGQFIARIEDTDQNRFVAGAEDVIFNSLDWFNLTPDESPKNDGTYGPYRQSERLEIYRKYVDELVTKKHAYYCFCTKERLDEMRKAQEKNHQPPMYDKHCLYLTEDQVKTNLVNKVPYVVRMNVPEGQTIKVQDALVGEVEFDSDLIDHQVILKSDGFPTYHLAVVVDDYLMKISHIIRGREWLPSTPKHVLLYQYFGWENEMPKFIHLPLILNSDGKGKLSKRDGHASVDYYKEEGFLPEAILNYLSNIVWNHPEGKEIYNLEELEKAIDINSPRIINLTAQAPRFDLNKLEWVNGEYIRMMSDDGLTQRLHDFLVDHPDKDKIAPLVPLVKERIKKLSDFIPLTNFIFEKPEYEKAVFDKVKLGEKDPQEVMGRIKSKLEEMAQPWQTEIFESEFRKLAEELGIPAGSIFQMIRILVSGQPVTPPLFESIKILGEKETLERVNFVVSNYPNF